MNDTFFRSGKPYTIEQIAERITLLQHSKHVGNGVMRWIDVPSVPGARAILYNVVRLDHEGRAPIPDDEALDLGSVALSSQHLDKDGIRPVLETNTRITSKEEAAAPKKFHAHRHPGRGEWGTVPCWQIDVEAYRPREAIIPVGPFLIAQHGLFFERLPSLAAWWTGRSLGSPHSLHTQLHPNLTAIVPDYRAYFEGISVTEEGLSVEVHRGTSEDLYVVASGTDLFDRPVTTQSRVGSTDATLRLDRTLKTVKIYLLGERTSEPYDVHTERYYRATPGDVLVGTSVTTHNSIRLEEMVQRGEGPSIEFKPWLDPDDKKIRELVESVVAFANVSGGSVLIGITDYGDIVGVERDMRRLARSQPADQARSEYARQIFEYVTTTVKPRIQPTLEWHRKDDHWVLEVRVASHRGEAHFLPETKEVFVRRGATNERITAWDAAAMSSSGPGGHSGPGTFPRPGTP